MWQTDNDIQASTMAYHGGINSPRIVTFQDEPLLKYIAANLIFGGLFFVYLT